MRARLTFAKIAMLLTAVSIQGVASAQNYSGWATANSQSSPAVNRVKWKVSRDARASRVGFPARADYGALGGAFGAAPAAGMSPKKQTVAPTYKELQNSTRSHIEQPPNETWRRTYPDYPFQSGGVG
jgi:hypothetical protein